MKLYTIGFTNNESRENCLYSAAYFILVELPRKAQEVPAATT